MTDVSGWSYDDGLNSGLRMINFMLFSRLTVANLFT